jgi:hypothetical protein
MDDQHYSSDLSDSAFHLVKRWDTVIRVSMQNSFLCQIIIFVGSLDACKE